MNKSKEVGIFLGRFFKEQLPFIVLYFIIVALFGSTFFLYDVPAAVYTDILLFTLPLLLLFLLGRGLILWRKHSFLNELQQQAWFHVLTEKMPAASLLEQDYQQLLQKLAQQVQLETSSHEAQEQELMDYYALWSHQIKTPLAALDLQIQRTEEPVKKRMKAEVFKIQQYLEMMLQYLRLQAIQNDFRFESFTLQELVRPVIKKYAAFFIHKDLEVQLTHLEGTVVTDAKWFSFILEQIIFNAVKYTNAGGITIYTLPERPQELHIKDTGQGILAEDVPRVFEKGYTGFNGRENQKASGLGLFMSQEIAKQLGVKLSLTSVVGQGTEVVLDVSRQQIEIER